MTFPLDVRFKLLAIASRIPVRDASGAAVSDRGCGGAEIGVLQRQGMQPFCVRITTSSAASRFVGIFAGYFFNPSYLLTRAPDVPPLLRVLKRQALLERSFEIEAVSGEPRA